MYRDRVGGGVGSSRSEMVASRGKGPLDWKWIINNALDKHLEKSSLSTSRVDSGINSSSKDKERISMPSTSTSKSQQHQQLNHRDSCSTSLSKNKCSNGMYFMYIKFWTLCVCFFFIWVYWVLVVSICCFCF